MEETMQKAAGDAADSSFAPPLMRQTVTICSLSTELLADIFSYLEKTDSTFPSWKPWLTYRRVNRRFRGVVEMLHIQRYLRRSAVVVDRDAYGQGRDGCSHDFYEFAGFCGEHTVEGGWDQLAVFRKRKEQARTRRRSVTEVVQSEQVLCLPAEYSYHPKIIMSIGTGATDLLPLDLRWFASNEEGKEGLLVFNWRLYFCCLFAEIRQEAVLEAHVHKKKQACRHVSQMCQQSDQTCPDNDDSEFEIKMSLVQLATSLYTRDQDQTDCSTSPMAPDAAAIPISTVTNPGVYDLTTLTLKSISHTSNPDISQSTAEGDKDDHQFLSPHARAQLILAAGTYDIGCDGRYREMRRQRRRRIWWKQQGCDTDDEGIRNKREDENEEQRKQRKAFERYEEGKMARKLLMLSVEIEKMGRTVEW